LEHIPFSHLPLKFESSHFWRLHPRNESRAGLTHVFNQLNPACIAVI
jgi:hypothetical protein